MIIIVVVVVVVLVISRVITSRSSILMIRRCLKTARFTVTLHLNSSSSPPPVPPQRLRLLLLPLVLSLSLPPQLPSFLSLLSPLPPLNRLLLSLFFFEEFFPKLLWIFLVCFCVVAG